MAGPPFSVAGVVGVLPTELEKIASYSLPRLLVEATTWSVVVVLPESEVSGANVTPPSVLTSHCTVGAGYPYAAALNVAVLPSVTDWLTGLVVTTGATGLLPIICTSPSRSLPEELFSAVPEILTLSAPVAAFTMRMPKLELLLTPLMPAKFTPRPLYQLLLLPPPVISKYPPCTVLALEVLFWTEMFVSPLPMERSAAGTLVQVLPSVVYSTWIFASPCAVA